MDINDFRVETTKRSGFIYDESEVYYDDSGNMVARIITGKNRDTKEKWLLNLFISDNYRGNGLSYQLLDIAVNKYGIRGLTVTSENKIAIHTYEKYGFEFDNNGGGRFCAMRIK